MQGMLVQHAIKGVYAVAIAWVIVAVVNSKPWGSQQTVQQPTQQPIAQSTPYPDALASPSAEPIAPESQWYVGWVRTWNVTQTAKWVAWCLQNSDGIHSANPEDQQICKALKLK